MYSVLVCAAFALLVAISGTAFDVWHWGWSIPIALLLFVVSWVLLARTLTKRLQPTLERARKQLEAGLVDEAIASFDSLMPLGKWVPLLRGQLQAQMGVLAYHSGKEERAIALLEGASIRVPDAKLMLAAILYRRNAEPRALELMKLCAMVHKKHALLHNTYAWMLHKQDRNDEAQAVLATFLKRDPNNAPSKDNLLRLQNRTRMNMQGFEMQWYALGLERPPQAMGQMRRAPKGFREPPKRR